MFAPSKKKLFKPAFLKEFFYGERKAIEHETPRSLTKDGKQHVGADAQDFQFFDDFRFFAEIINPVFDDTSWTMHERADTDIGRDISFGPEWGPQSGRCYEIFYNRIKAGKLLIYAAPMSAWMGQPYNGHINAHLCIRVFPLRLLDYQDITHFLRTIALYLEYCPGRVSRADIATKVNEQLLPILWRIDLEDENSWMFSDVEMHLSDCFPFVYYDSAQGRHGVDLHSEQMQNYKAQR